MRISDWSSDVCSSDLPIVTGIDHGLDGLQRGLDRNSPRRLPRDLDRLPVRRDRLDLTHQLTERHVDLQEDPAVFEYARYHEAGQADRDDAWRQAEIGRATSELQSLMRISYAVFCLKKKNTISLTSYCH